MLNYLSSHHYKEWEKKRKIKYWCLFILASILHLFLLILGYKKLMTLLGLFLKKNKPLYYSHNIEEVRMVKKQVNPLFKTIRNSKYSCSNCFSTSILLWFILKKQGLAPSIIIGTKKEKGIFKAHAWVELNQFPINENVKIKKTFSSFDYNF